MPKRYSLIFANAQANLALFDACDPNPAHLTAAQSGAYYALFHAVCQHCADTLIPHSHGYDQRAAWMKFYRAPNHSIFNKRAMANHNKELTADIAAAMRNGAHLKQSRQWADYDPDYNPSYADAAESLILAEDAIAALETAPRLHLIKLAAHLLTPYRPEP